MGLMAMVQTLQREPFHPWDVTRCSRELYWLGELVLSLAGMTLVSLGQGTGQGGGPMRHQLRLLSRALPLRRVQVAQPRWVGSSDPTGWGGESHPPSLGPVAVSSPLLPNPGSQPAGSSSSLRALFLLCWSEHGFCSLPPTSFYTHTVVCYSFF